LVGITHDVPEKVLGHKLKGVDTNYNQHDSLIEQIAAYGEWISNLDRLI